MSGPGRPADHDELNVYLFVEVGRARTGLSVRQFCGRRDTAYWGSVAVALDTKGRRYVKGRRRPLRGDTLRRRYGKAKQALGLTPPPMKQRAYGIYRGTMDKAREVMDRMVNEVLATV